MPFNAADPADSEKIRQLGIVIRPNWKAIEEGSQTDTDNTDVTVSQKLKLWSVNFFDRSDITSAPGADAPKVDNSIVAYSKTDSDTGFAELFTRHEDSTVTQVTKGPASIGSGGFANNGETSIYGGLLIKYGVTAILSSNSTVVQTFTDIGLTAFPNNLFTVLITPVASSSSANVQTLSTTAFSIKNTSGTRAFNWLAIGN